MKLLNLYTCTLLLLLSLTIFAQSNSSKPTYTKSQKTVIIKDKKYYIHTIAPKQTLFSISKIYGVSIDEIIKENPSTAKTITIGKQIRIPYYNPIEKAPIDPSNEDNPNDNNNNETAGTAQYIRSTYIETFNGISYYIHVIQPKQTLFATAKLYSIDINELITTNPDVSKSYKIGEELIIPVKGLNINSSKEKKAVFNKAGNDVIDIKVDQPAGNTNNQIYHKYIIQPKQTLYSIARTYSVSMDELKKINWLSGNDIELGDTLLIPINKDNSKISLSKNNHSSSSKSNKYITINGDISTEYTIEQNSANNLINESETLLYSDDTQTNITKITNETPAPIESDTTNTISQISETPFTEEQFPEKSAELKVAIDAIKKGDKYYRRKPSPYSDALTYYFEAYKLNPNNASLNLKIGTCYSNLNQYDKALSFLERAYKLNETISEKLLFLLAQAAHINKEFDKAITSYKAYKTKLTPDKAEEITTIDKKIKECYIGKEILKDTLQYTAINLGPKINSIYPNNNAIVDSYPEKGKIKESTITFSSDMKTMYFISDRTGGFGGKDIYMSHKNKSGEWVDVTNLGSIINTLYDEEGIFLSKDNNTLYFSSKGHSTMGGFDVFKTMTINNQWIEPQNLGYPINSTADDVFYRIDTNEKYAYISSSRNGTYGDLDIYKIDFEPTIINKTKEPVIAKKTIQPIHLNTRFTNKSTGEELTVKLFVKNKITDSVLIQQKVNGHTTMILPSENIYEIVVEADNYLSYTLNLNVPRTTEDKMIPKEIKMKKLEVGAKVILKNVFFDFRKSTIRPESITELNRLLNLLITQQTIRLEISGHTDNVGSWSFNKRLSENRAKAVVTYLINNGIESSRLEYKGFAYDIPIASNNTEEGKQLNNRIEFKILK